MLVFFWLTDRSGFGVQARHNDFGTALGKDQNATEKHVQYQLVCIFTVREARTTASNQQIPVPLGSPSISSFELKKTIRSQAQFSATKGLQGFHGPRLVKTG